MRVRAVVLAAVLLGGCEQEGDDADAGDLADVAVADALPDGDAGGLAPDALPEPPPPDDVFVREHVVNIVDPQAAEELRRVIAPDQQGNLRVVSRAFFAAFADEYDFVYFFPDHEVPNGVAGQFEHVRHPALPGTGIDGAYEEPGYGSAARARGVVALNLHAVGNGPTLHETLHYWGVFLDRDRFGFGRDAETDFGPHWGVAGVNGQLGGFDPETLGCAEGGEPPACAPGPDGRPRFTLGGFGPTTNGGDGVPYAPLELYLMGLVPAGEVPGPIPVLREAELLGYDQPTDTITMAAAGVELIEVEDIVARHGEVEPIPADARNFRAAFAVISAEPASAEVMDRAETWARIFSDALPSSFLFGFERATGGRATMDARPGRLRER